MIYTSYYAKYRGDKGVSISRFPPKWWEGSRCSDLAPPKRILMDFKQGKINEFEFEAKFRKYLSILNIEYLYQELDGSVLLCFEKNANFCHRHIVASWFRENGFQCKELEYD